MIKVKNLTRNFGRIVAVDGISFDVAKGEVLGFLGPNGAGKTTTMRVVTGYLEPSGGSVLIDGTDIRDNPESAKSRIGYLPENAPVYRDMHVYGFLKFAAEIRGISGKKAAEAIDRAVSICHLESVLYQSIDTLSKGYTRRTVLAQAILHDPPILILDEPTDGLDPNQKFEVRNMINRMSENKAIVISTHILEEVEACCTRAIIIARGRIVANGTPAELKTMSEQANTVLMGVRNCDFAAMRDSLSGIGQILKISDAGSESGVTRIRIHPDKCPAGALAAPVSSFAREKGWEIVEFSTDSGRLDDVFRKITLGSGEEAKAS